MIRKKRMTILDKAEAAMKKAIKQLVEDHRKSGHPLAIWEDGKVKMLYLTKKKK